MVGFVMGTKNIYIILITNYGPLKIVRILMILRNF